MSRLRARPEFQKLEATLSVTQPVAEHRTLDLRARGQISFNPALPRSKQIGLANVSGRSSFDASLFQGDEGDVVRGASYGIGIRFAASPQASFTNLRASVEYGRSERSDRLPADDRITVSVALPF